MCRQPGRRTCMDEGRAEMSQRDDREREGLGRGIGRSRKEPMRVKNFPSLFHENWKSQKDATPKYKINGAC